MAKYIDMTGWIMRDHNVKDSNIKVLNIAEDETKKHSHGIYWNCECLLCGKHFITRGDNIRSGKRKDCKEHTIKQTSNIAGQTFNYLTALENTYKKGNNGNYIWKCQCKCGNIVEVNRQYLITGDVKSCGCLNKEHLRARKIDMIGKTFGFLTVLSELPERRERDKRIIYHCKCKCGNYCDVDGIALRNGNTKSCGCYKRETTSNKMTKNLLNQTFGLLTAIELLPEPDNDGRRQWRCKCECGNEIIVSSHRLLSGNTTSCGCAKASIGETVINNILKENNYKFIYNKPYFDDLISQNNTKLRYDFIILNENNEPCRFIEFDGPQHTKSYDFFGGQEHYENLKYCDNLKNEYAFSHNIPIVRIPYKEKTNITIEMLMGDQYLVRPRENPKRKIKSSFT